MEYICFITQFTCINSIPPYSTRMRLLPFLITAAFFTSLRALAHESAGHPTRETGAVLTEIGTELYLGKHGYWHGGAALTVPLGSKLSLVLGAHVVREETGAKEVPSFEAELIREFAHGLEVEAFGFGYTKVERKQAWGVGVRATKRFALQGGLSVAPFFGPAYARVEALEEAKDEAVTVGHLMLLGGVTLEAGLVSVTLLGSHSFYNRDPSDLETPVDIESMTHFAAYENNDGFARDTVAVELAWEVTEWLTLHARYAAMWFDEETRHAVAFTPAVKLGEHVELTAGVQFLRGGEVENDLLFGGLSVSF